MDRGGAQLAFHDISFHVQLKNGETKKILTNVSGLIDNGHLCYMMGPSGAGKSSLLDALADRVKAKVTGEILLDGAPADPECLKIQAKYVQQEDHLIPILTVRQTFECMASFYTTDREEVRKRVGVAIELLGLTKQENTIIGGPLLRGLSGGQKRRVSIGCELVSLPRIMFLDEPTSGLDSAAAWAVVSALKDVSKNKGTTLVITIHQPSEKLFRISDRFLLLSDGQLCFMGDTDMSVKHFQALGCELPPMTSSADWMLEIVDTSFQDKAHVQPLIDAWASSPSASSLLEKVSTLCKDAKPRSFPCEPHTGFLWQTRILFWRMCLNVAKNPMVIWLRVAMYFALSVMISTVWNDVGRNGPDQDSVSDIINAMFFIAAFMVFMSISVLPAFLEEKAVFVKERANGAYGVLPFNIAHVLVDLLPLLFMAIVNGTVCYYSIGLNEDFDRFLYYIVDLFFSFVVAEALMFLIAVIVPNFVVGIASGAMAYGGFMIAMGFLIRVEDIGWWWRWLHYIGLHSYSFSGFMYNEFHGRVFDCSVGGVWPCKDGKVTGDFVLEHYDFEDTDKWANIVVLAAMSVIYRIIAITWMYYFHTGKK